MSVVGSGLVRARRCGRNGLPGRLAVAACAVLLAAACTTLPPNASAGRSYAGRFSLAVGDAPPGGPGDAPAGDIGGDAPPAQSGAAKAWNGRFALLVGDHTMSLDLVSPLGATIARFETAPGEARLLVPDGGHVRTEYGSGADALAQRVLGWSLPFAGFGDWIEGHPAPERPYQRQSATVGVSAFEQDGWSVTVEEPAPGHPGRRLQVRRPPLPDSPAVSLRVVLDATDAG